MGVMPCSRNRCESILCDTHVDGIGYICHGCQEEFKDFLSEKGISPETEGQIKESLSKFMETEKGTFNGEKISIEDFFRTRTRQ